MTGGLPRLVDAINTPDSAPTPSVAQSFFPPS